MNKDTIRVGGVPEHFNLPVHLAIEQGLFEGAGLDISWTDYEGGTGAMAKALEAGECDVCILLTEGIISAILKGNPSKVISGYVKSPLTWGIHTGVQSGLSNHTEIYDKQIAISRLGSGSHLMPTVDGLMNDQKVAQGQFVVVNNLQGALQSLNAGETDVFYWEKYTTKPYVEQGLLRRISEFVTPWPCFLIAATERIIAERPQQLAQMLKVIHRSCEEFMENPKAAEMVAQRYGISLQDASKWFHATEWALDSWVSNKVMENVLYTLKEAGITENGQLKPEALVWVR